MKKQIEEKTAIYQSSNGAIQLKADAQQDTIWANLLQIAELFDTDKSGELSQKGTVANFATVQKEGSREVARDIEHYSLDVILSVGYRINSKKATHFRQWATKTLKDHIHKGYTINRNRIQKNYTEFLKAVDDVKTLLPADTTIDHASILELVTLFADTWFSLDAYDKDKLISQGTTKKKVTLTADKLNKALAELKQNLISKKEATAIFGVERIKDSITGIIGNVMQSFGGEELYPSIEEKAAHWLYFIINSPYAALSF